MKGRGSSRDAAGMNMCGSPVHVSSDAPRLPRSHALEVPGKILIDEPCASQKKHTRLFSRLWPQGFLVNPSVTFVYKPRAPALTTGSEAPFT